MMNIPNKKPGRAVKKTITAFEGDTIQFSRKGVEADGIVTKVGENSVIVSLTDEIAIFNTFSEYKLNTLTK